MPESDEAALSIGVFARRSRLSAKALRLYERVGVLAPAAVDESNGYRRYRPSQLEDARLVVALRRLDMPLARVAAVLAAETGERAALVEAYGAEVERRVAGQRHLLAHLLTRLAGEEGNYAMYDIQVREVDEQRVLTEQCHITAVGLPDWIRATVGRMYETAEQLDVLAGPSFVVYHGEVTEDSDGPVECCLPVTSAAEVPGQAWRMETAHREAYTRVPVAQIAYPQILSAYEAVERWVRDQGREVAGPPREVYFADLSQLGPDDPGCDIAYPIH